MGRKRRGIPIHGWLILDKPLGLSSNGAVGAVRRATNAAKVGHGGTLDPLATGVLPIALGEATKTVSYVMDGAKTYRFTVRWGEERNTDDAEGEVTATSNVRPDDDAIERVLPEFRGEIEQVPPVFSAIKVNGQRAYKLARADQQVTLAARTVRIDQLLAVANPADSDDADHATFEVSCGKGTYVRSLARDLARRLGTVGHVSALRRTRVGPFYEKDAISLEMLDGFMHSAPSENYLLPIETVLDDIPALALTDTEADRMRNGQGVSLSEHHVAAVENQLPENSPVALTQVVLATCNGVPVALARLDDGVIRPFRVLNMQPISA